MLTKKDLQETLREKSKAQQGKCTMPAGILKVFQMILEG